MPWKDIPDEQRIFTANQIIEIFEITRFHFLKVRDRLKIQAKKFDKPQPKGDRYYYTYDDFSKLKTYFAKLNHEKEMNARRKFEIETEEERKMLNSYERLKKEHPLVTDVRCFNLNWWPDIIPDCFKVSDNDTIAD